MSLFYPPNERVFHGKTSDREDMVNVRFVELVSFVTTDPAFFGEMTIIATFKVINLKMAKTLGLKCRRLSKLAPTR